MTTRQQFHASAPGRLDVLGGVADYSGGLVLQTPVRAKTSVNLEPIVEKHIELHSDGMPSGTMSLTQAGEILTTMQQRGLDQGGTLLRAAEIPHWCRYPMGCLLVLTLRKKWFPPSGASLRFASNVPEGAGVSSSAAIEIATLRVLAQWGKIVFAGTEMARIGQEAENHMAGAPCGLMDQLASAHGEPGKLLPIRCTPDVLEPAVSLPPNLTIAGWPSGVKHSVGGDAYGRARCAAFMGKRMLESACGKTAPFLATIPWETFEPLRDNLPETLSGRDFLESFGDVDDPLSQVRPQETYPVRAAASFPIEESRRSRRLLDLLARDTPNARKEMGELLFASHAAYSAMGLGASETDRIVASLRSLGPSSGILGGRISGGGSGGTVVVLLQTEALPALEKTARYPLIHA